MNLHDFLKALEATPLAAAVRGATPGWDWLFPIVETVHVIALALVFSSIVMLDLRLVGMASRESSVSRLSRELLPITWTAFVVAAISGSLLFTGKASYYMVNPWFLGKMALMGLAGVNMIAFHLIPWTNVRTFDVATVIPGGVKRAGILSLLLWIGVICCGRMIGFTLDKYLPF